VTQKSKLVTLAIHTYQKAQIVKAFLEREGIDVSLQNVNQTQPEVSSGVRIRIKESDLPRALRLVENSQLLHGEENPVSAKSHKRTILIPVDFSEYSIQACELGFNYAKDTEAEIAVLHAFFSPLFPDTLAFNEPFNHQNINEESKDFLLDKAQEDLDRFEAFIRKKVMDKEWPDVHFTCVLRDGLPEVEIENYSKQVKAEMIIMGTRGKDQKDVELIGSVTAEVIETAKIPVLAIPEKTPFHTLSQVRKIAFGTSFEQRDLIAIDQLFTMLKSYRIDYYLFHLTHQPNVWNEIKLAGIKDYFLKQYPDIPIHYKIMGANDPVLSLEKFVRDESIDIISLSTYKRNLFSRIFNPSIARKMLFHTDTPLLALRF
jgi:nucleotide-binding universal stress UspA family protein